jgi:hypothetical protein
MKNDFGSRQGIMEDWCRELFEAQERLILDFN